MAAATDSVAEDVAAPAAAPYALPVEEVARRLGADCDSGLSGDQARARLAHDGPNRPSRPERPAYLRIGVRQLLDPLVALLLAAATVSATIGEGIEAAVIMAIVVLNAVLGFVQEAAAERAVLALRDQARRSAAVVRDGREHTVPVEDVVPGDLVVLREGERVPADARVVAATRLEADESALTGESVPVPKDPTPVDALAPLAERSSMVYAGTAITRGRGLSLVAATGDATELGAIGRLTAQAKPPPTPLQRRFAALARVMVAIGVAVTLVLAGAMLLRGSSLHEAFLVGVAVAVAAVPEGLSATVTIALALGARTMASAGAIVRRLAAIESLGETTVICTDKTGTLTENRLRLAAAFPVRTASELELLTAAVLASSAELVERDGRPAVSGDPVEGALLLAAMEHGLSRSDLLRGRRQVYEVPFAPERKRVTVVYEEGGGRRAYVKGAPEVVLGRSVDDCGERGRLEVAAEAWAEEGLRVLAVGSRALEPGEPLEDDLDRELDLLGLVALHDPLRPSAPGAIGEARAAGIEVRMLTGDHPRTAQTIGHALGLPAEAVFARVTPADKLRLVEELQDAGHVVAVTGDGVNDAPALRQADVGVAMGCSGTEAAREASAIVLTDDDFATIVAAIREGRRIADNVRKFVAFLLSANLGEVVLFAVAVIGGLGAPMTVVQVLTVNVLTDGIPALALARDPSSPETMALGPRRGALFSRPLAYALAAAGALVGFAGLGAYLIGRALDGGAAQTMAFATIALAELALVFSCRSVLRSAWRVPGNAHLTWGVAASAALLGATLYVPALHELFGTVSLGATELVLVLGLALVPALAVETAKALVRGRSACREAS
jgi:Ca2+-transporting ATPase